jgi:hypothetical protein
VTDSGSKYRLETPWELVELDACYKVQSANGHGIAYIYYDDNPIRRDLQKQLTKDEARRVASNIRKLPELLGKVKPGGA